MMDFLGYKGRYNSSACRYFFCMAWVGVFLLLVSACGRKAPPLPPTAEKPPVVEKLDFKMDGDRLTLTWKIPKWEGEAGNRLAGFYVYRSKEKLDGDGCKGCPVRFERAADVPIDFLTARFRFQEGYSESLDKGFRYGYKVSCYTEDKQEGEASAPVEIDFR